MHDYGIGVLRDSLWLVLIVLLLFSADLSSANNVVQYIPDGGFELGVIGVDIVRYPRYGKATNNHVVRPTWDASNPLAGSHSLRLPGLLEGGYRLVYQTMPLVGGELYDVSFDAQAFKGSASVKIEVFSKWSLVEGKKVALEKGVNHVSFSFNAASKPLISGGRVPHFLRIWIKSKHDVSLDSISLLGKRENRTDSANKKVWIEPEKSFAVYPVGGQGDFNIRAIGCEECRLFYRINDPVSGQALSEGDVPKMVSASGGLITGKIPLFLDRRGYFLVYVHFLDVNGKEKDVVEHAYVVINSDSVDIVPSKRFGVAMEEYGPLSQIDAFAEPGDYYELAREIGVGSVRIFSLLMPDMVSKDGKHFDFSQADAALKIIEGNSIEPMVVLGSNSIHRIPEWMRREKAGKNTLDLLNGLFVPAEREKFKQSKAGRYMDLEVYERYLEAVFDHLKGKVKYFEIWNEPGHKFVPKDFIKIARLTRSVQQRVDSTTRLLGYSSTRRGQIGVGKDPMEKPRFLQEMLEIGGIEDIDILSYHSGHAFLFNSSEADRRNQETGFVPRLRSLLDGQNRVDMPIWDTERGIPWKSTHKGRIDYMAGVGRWEHETESLPVLDVARQLPMVYAAAFANGVERLFWFYMESSAGLIQRSTKRWGLFDAQREPMPLIPVYDAMTEILGDASFERLVEDLNGSRAYVFRDDSGVIVLAYNWREKMGSLVIEGVDRGRIDILDIMGSPIKNAVERNEDTRIPIDAWPIYARIPGSMSVSISVE